MKAILCNQLGPADKLVLTDSWSLPQTGPDQVRIAVHAAGLNFPDALIIEGKYQIKPDLPFVPGEEAAGVVVEVGANVRQFKPGDKVVATSVTGAFCEQMLVDAAAVLPMPEGLDMVQAAGVCITYLTSYHALKQRACLQPGESLLVLGAGGGVGLAAVELGKLMGARVIAAASSDEKLAVAKSRGADELINYTSGDFREQLRGLVGKQGVDVVYDPVGGDFSEAALRSMAWKGRLLVVGFATGEIPRLPLHLILLKGCDVLGVSSGVFPVQEPEEHLANVEALWRYFAEGKLKPVIGEVFPWQEYRAAFDAMTGRRATGKLVLAFTP